MLNKAKRYYYLSGLLFRSGVVFWFLETAYFLISDGWHLRAVRVEEKICDFVVELVWVVAGYLFIKCIAIVVGVLIDTMKTK